VTLTAKTEGRRSSPPARSRNSIINRLASNCVREDPRLPTRGDGRGFSEAVFSRERKNGIPHLMEKVVLKEPKRAPLRKSQT